MSADAVRPPAPSHPLPGRRPVPVPDPPPTMTAVVTDRYGPPEVLAVREVPVPAPRPHEVLVAVEASSLNALDWHLLTGTPYLVRPANGLLRPRRRTPGADVAGTVLATGSRVTAWRPGDRVFGEAAGGGCAPYAVVDAAHLVALPAEVSARDAGATPVAGVTALQALRTHGRVRSGEHVIVNGAAGGVGTFAVQVAKALGAEVTAVCSGRNVDLVRSLGADRVVDHTAEDVTSTGVSADVVLDGVGNHPASAWLPLLRPGARFVAISGPKSNRWLGPVPHLVRTALAFRRAEPSFHQFTAAPVREDLEQLGAWLASGTVRPAVDRVVGLGGVVDALTEIGGGHTRAKIVVDPSVTGPGAPSGP
ncbi:NAD(P)-dependent alcohol dehydrogenase [Phycicoccus flavus]|uniref:NAD(P)-dependent alcohol dehydrogenase n=1 Tax=Phycicoccus flavus TaxID=2502783 RepID=UPI000FEBE0E2|nr:NAD(P)-dependent alcohol dehydrogenase [Phycicoccus flavus]NHA66678.1 NAD(P)-dependent alcohol dehydrogenase [Phycicoccus flavus]